jgi:hypothetical protein
MSDRLKELQRQRALAQEQVDWFDREIAALAGGQATVSAAPPSPAPVPVPAAVPSAPSSTEATAMAEQILSQYRRPGGDVQADIKRGCILYFIFALGALAILAVGAYVLYRSTHH